MRWLPGCRLFRHLRPLAATGLSSRLPTILAAFLPALIAFPEYIARLVAKDIIRFICGPRDWLIGRSRFRGSLDRPVIGAIVDLVSAAGRRCGATTPDPASLVSVPLRQAARAGSRCRSHFRCRGRSIFTSRTRRTVPIAYSIAYSIAIPIAYTIPITGTAAVSTPGTRRTVPVSNAVTVPIPNVIAVSNAVTVPIPNVIAVAIADIDVAVVCKVIVGIIVIPPTVVRVSIHFNIAAGVVPVIPIPAGPHHPE